MPNVQNSQMSNPQRKLSPVTQRYETIVEVQQKIDKCHPQ